MFCPTCGTNNPDGGAACKICGSDLRAAAEGLSRPPPAPMTTGIRPKKPPVATMLGVAQPGQGNVAPPVSQPIPVSSKPARAGTMLGIAMPAVGSAPMPVGQYAVKSPDRPLGTPRALLASLLRSRGPQLSDNPAELEALLYQMFQHQVALLLAAQRAGVPAALSAAPSTDGVAACVERMTGHLARAHGISIDDARFAVESWALALGVAGE